MTKIAIISDIHANHAALSAVLSAISRTDYSELIVAGDILGYYFEPAQVIDELQKLSCPKHIIKGNHEEMYVDALASSDYLDEISAKYGPGHQIAVSALTYSQQQWIRQLPCTVSIARNDISISVCHGSPASTSEYVYPDTDIDKFLSNLPSLPHILILGHTHYPMTIRHTDCLLINPGSVGQPRNNQPGAHWALLDLDTMEVEHMIEHYDASLLCNLCHEIAPNHPYLQTVLTRK